MTTQYGRFLWSITAVALGGSALAAQPAFSHPPRADSSDLARGFRQPPNAARPRVWWHWIGGNVDPQGAKLDLEWMQRVGVGGLHIFSGNLSGPSVVPKPVPFMSDKWKATLREAIRIAQPAEMEIGIAGSPGWSQTGGPWVLPEDGMKKYVWSETRIRGGAKFSGTLQAPPVVTGPYQALKRGGASASFYKDSHVVAFRSSVSDGGSAPTLSTSDPSVNLAAIASGDLSGKIRLPVTENRPQAWVEAHYASSVPLSAVTLGLPAGAMVQILASDDGTTFRTVGNTVVQSPSELTHPLEEQTIAFPVTRARTFRIALQPLAPPPPLALGPNVQRPAPSPSSYVDVSKVVFEAGGRVNRFQAKAGFESSIGDGDLATPPGDESIAERDVIDLSDRLQSDGRLEWSPPAGDWTVLRFGWSLTGQTNGPAESASTGLEVDKLDALAVERYIGHYLELYQDASNGALGDRGIQTLLTDSWEAGAQNWTPTIRAEFRKRRGYEMLPFIPVLAGRVVGSAQASDRFLWDYRQTLKDLVVSNHYAVLARAVHVRGMSYYTEVQGDTPRAIVDGMTAKARADIPTAEFWYRPFAAGPGQYALQADLEEAASAAHVYGKPLAAAESLTVAAVGDPWGFSPRMLKPVADEIFAHGINRIIIHDSLHQPLTDKKPGTMMGIFGQFFNRNDTWAEDAGAWVDYLSRTSHMLQQGRFVADIAYFYGEERNLTELFRRRPNTDVPPGYHYDYINPEAVNTLLSVKEGRLTTPSGMSYGVLYIPTYVTRYTLPTLRRIRDLVSAGAIVVGPKPVGGLGRASPDTAVRAIADAVWGNGPTAGHRFGKGMAYGTTSLAPVLATRGIAPDVCVTGAGNDARLLTVHRRTDDADIYFISNQRARPETVEASFRVAGKAPELWRAETGDIEPLGYRLDGDRVTTSLRLAPEEAMFVVFRRPADASKRSLPVARESTLATLAGPWSVTFEAGRGAPTAATFPTLFSWSEAKEPGIRYFSGAGTYTKDVDVPAAWLAHGRRLMLDLGEVRELTTIDVNGTRVATAWHPPYRVDLTGKVHAGRNRLEIRVVNLWSNRLIGDKQPGVQPIAFAPQSSYRAETPLRPSGLLGPVRLIGVLPDTEEGGTPSGELK